MLWELIVSRLGTWERFVEGKLDKRDPSYRQVYRYGNKSPQQIM